MKCKIIVLSALLSLLVSCTVSNTANDTDIEEKVEYYLSQMTLEEKVGILHAQSKFSSRGVPRLGIPELWTTDGPHGIRAEMLWDEWDQAGWTNDSITAFPALSCLAATWTKLYDIPIRGGYLQKVWKRI